jgi:transposase
LAAEEFAHGRAGRVRGASRSRAQDADLVYQRDEPRVVVVVARALAARQLPGLGRRLAARIAARIAGEIGEHIEQFTTPNSLQCYAGCVPVTRRPGKRDLVVARRLACNRYLAGAVHKQAFASLRRSAWAGEFYDAQRARGKNHHTAL